MLLLLLLVCDYSSIEQVIADMYGGTQRENPSTLLITTIRANMASKVAASQALMAVQVHLVLVQVLERVLVLVQGQVLVLELELVQVQVQVLVQL